MTEFFANNREWLGLLHLVCALLYMARLVSSFDDGDYLDVESCSDCKRGRDSGGSAKGRHESEA